MIYGYSTDGIYKNITIKMDRLDKKHKYVVKMSKLAGKQGALLSFMSAINDRKQRTKRKTIDIDTVQDMLLSELDKNSKEVRKLKYSDTEGEKIIHLEEFEKWQELK